MEGQEMALKMDLKDLNDGTEKNLYKKIRFLFKERNRSACVGYKAFKKDQ